MVVSEQIIMVLDDICAKLGVAVDWTAQNVMPYIQEMLGRLVKYELWTSVASIVLTGVALFALVKFTVYFWKRADFKSYDIDHNQAFAAIGMVLSVFLAVAFIFSVCINSTDIVACLTFPEKIIFDELKTAVASLS